MAWLKSYTVPENQVSDDSISGPSSAYNRVRSIDRNFIYLLEMKLKLQVNQSYVYVGQKAFLYISIKANDVLSWGVLAAEAWASASVAMSRK